MCESEDGIKIGVENNPLALNKILHKKKEISKMTKNSIYLYKEWDKKDGLNCKGSSSLKIIYFNLFLSLWC